MGVANRNGYIHAKQVDLLLAGFVPQLVPLALGKDQRRFIRHEGALRGSIECIATADDTVCRPVDFKVLHLLALQG